MNLYWIYGRIVIHPALSKTNVRGPNVRSFVAPGSEYSLMRKLVLGYFSVFDYFVDLQILDSRPADLLNRFGGCNTDLVTVEPSLRSVMTNRLADDTEYAKKNYFCFDTDPDRIGLDDFEFGCEIVVAYLGAALDEENP